MSVPSKLIEKKPTKRINKGVENDRESNKVKIQIDTYPKKNSDKGKP